MAIIEVSIVPIGTENPGIASYVAEAVKIFKNAGIKYNVTPMGTVLEGELSSLLELIQKAHESCFSAGAKRVLTHIKIDDRRDKKQSAEEKVAAVIEKL